MENLFSSVWFWMAVAVFLFFLFCVRICAEKYAVILTWFGSTYSRTVYQGFYLKWPFPIEVGFCDVDLRVTQVSQDVKIRTADNAFVGLPVHLQFKVVDPYKSKYALAGGVGQLMTYVLTELRSICAGLRMRELFEKKAEDLKVLVLPKLKEVFDTYGFELVDLLVDQPVPSKEVQDAFDHVIASKRLKEAAEFEGDAEKVKRTKAAEAQKAALEIQAKAYVNFRDTIAKGLKEVMEKFRKAMPGIKDIQILEFLAGIDRREAARDVARHGGVIVLSDGNLANVLPNGVPQDLAALAKAVLKEIEKQKAATTSKK